MPKTTLIMPYYDNPGMLEKHYEHVRSLSRDVRDQLRIIVVDDGSPRSPAQPGDTDGVPLQIYRVLVDVRWNQHAARNIAVHHCTTDWMLMTDIDHIVPERTWRVTAMRDQTKSERAGTFFMFNRVSLPDYSPFKWHPNSYFMQRRHFDAVGGYDERFSGYYGTDSDLRRRLEARFKMVMIDEPIVRVPREVIPDASTTTYERKTAADAGVLKRIKLERAQDPAWQTKRMTFPYELVHSRG